MRFVRSFSIDFAIGRRLDAEAKRLGVSKSEVVNQALGRGLQASEDEAAEFMVLGALVFMSVTAFYTLGALLL